MLCFEIAAACAVSFRWLRLSFADRDLVFQDFTLVLVPDGLRRASLERLRRASLERLRRVQRLVVTTRCRVEIQVPIRTRKSRLRTAPRSSLSAAAVSRTALSLSRRELQSSNSKPRDHVCGRPAGNGAARPARSKSGFELKPRFGLFDGHAARRVAAQPSASRCGRCAAGTVPRVRGARQGRGRPPIQGRTSRSFGARLLHTLWVQTPQPWPLQINSLGCCGHSDAARRSAGPRCTRRFRRIRSYRRCSLLRACAHKARKAQRPSRPRHPLRADESTDRSGSYQLLPNGPCTHSSDRTRARSSVSTCLGVLLSLSTSLAGELPSASKLGVRPNVTGTPQHLNTASCGRQDDDKRPLQTRYETPNRPIYLPNLLTRRSAESGSQTGAGSTHGLSRRQHCLGLGAIAI